MLVNGFQNDVLTCMLKTGKTTIHRNFVAWVASMEAILSCSNLKHDDGFLHYSMPEVFNKTEHGLTDIITA